MDDEGSSATSQIFAEERRAAGAVDIIVAEDRDALAPLDSVRKTSCSLLHVGEPMRVGHQIAQARVQEAFGFLDGHASSRKNAAEDFRQAVGLRDRKRDRRARGIAALDPGPAEHGTGHAQDRSWRGKEG